MDRRERSGSGVTSLLAAFDGLQSQIWTALPGIIQSFDPVKQTARILPALKISVQQPDGSFVWVTMPELLDCPVQFAAGGGVSLTFPLKLGDECLVVFANRCIDNWWARGSPGHNTAQEQAEFRMHDLSDGFCIPGVSSVPRVIPTISPNTAQFRTDDGLTYVEVDPLGTVTVKASTQINLVAPVVSIVAPSIHMTGTVTLTGSLTASGDVVGSGTSLHTHIHPQSGGGNTGAPI
jgi:hypothetical protein